MTAGGVLVEFWLRPRPLDMQLLPASGSQLPAPSSLLLRLSGPCTAHQGRCGSSDTGSQCPQLAWAQEGGGTLGRGL